jgi:septum formation protein
MAVGLALRKARAVGAKRPEAWVIGADQVAWEPDRPDAPFGKPPDRSASARRLQRLRGRVHVLTTGLCLIGQGFEDVAVDHATLHMRPDLGEDEIAAYVDTGEGDGCAGGYAVERRGAFLFSRIDGDWNTVIGLPLFRLFDLLRARGWRAS